MKIMSVFGTRPEMIKMWGTLKKLDDLNFEHIMVHTGQNFTPELKDFFFKDLMLRAPDFDLGIDTSSYGKEVADVILKSDKLMDKVKPDALLILGDTYSGLSVMPAANKGIKIFHMDTMYYRYIWRTIYMYLNSQCIRSIWITALNKNIAKIVY